MYPFPPWPRLCSPPASVSESPPEAASQNLSEALARVEAPRELDERGAGYGDDAATHARLSLAELMAATQDSGDSASPSGTARTS